MKIEIDIPDDELRHCVSCNSGEMTLTLDVEKHVSGYVVTSVVNDTYVGNTSLKYREVYHPCKAEEVGWGDIRACDICSNKCEEYYQWHKESKDE